MRYERKVVKHHLVRVRDEQNSRLGTRLKDRQLLQVMRAKTTNKLGQQVAHYGHVGARAHDDFEGICGTPITVVGRIFARLHVFAMHGHELRHVANRKLDRRYREVIGYTNGAVWLSFVHNDRSERVASVELDTTVRASPTIDLDQTLATNVVAATVSHHVIVIARQTDDAAPSHDTVGLVLNVPANLVHLALLGRQYRAHIAQRGIVFRIG